MLADALGSLATILAPIGVGAEADSARLPRLVARMRAARAAIQAAIGTAGPSLALCEAIGSQADVTAHLLSGRAKPSPIRAACCVPGSRIRRRSWSCVVGRIGC